MELSRILLLLFAFLLASLDLIEAKRDGNQKFKVCCARQKKADKECKRMFCDFNKLSQDNISFFLNMCSPRGSTIKDMWDCASSHYDHTECCKKNNVIPECMRYCKADDVVTTDYKYLFCIQSFNGIRDCFRNHLDTHANIFGDN
ncbi:hypothetical protein QR680_000298 [Steinernema hermaphroditum]|uniref:Domain of unknown function DB domain-containing protein n=1 Tax=Steinernema hermaphroditum TaxID=289476 RepID=A0AA39GW51_9BILA|nr:hypothetical protein QR680_000298 [Steinernema hermaphroditum]